MIDFILPAVHGTVGVLASIKKYGCAYSTSTDAEFELINSCSPTVKRVVLTSSIASAAQHEPGAVHTEVSFVPLYLKTLTHVLLLPRPVGTTR